MSHRDADIADTADAIEALYRGRRGRVDFVDVPELGYAMVDGRGAPGGASFTDALQALYSVSYGAHFAAKKATGSRPRGRHHEIYLGDPRRAAPEKLRTILRQPIEPAATAHHPGAART